MQIDDVLDRGEIPELDGVFKNTSDTLNCNGPSDSSTADTKSLQISERLEGSYVASDDSINDSDTNSLQISERTADKLLADLDLTVS